MLVKQEERLQRVGAYSVVAMSNVFEAMAAKPFQSLGLPQAEIDQLITSIKKELRDPAIHSYTQVYFWKGRKPEEA